MKRFVGLLFALTSSHVFAVNWMFVGGNSSAGAYIDTDSLTKEKSSVLVWEMADFFEAQVETSGKPFSFNSLIKQTIYGCSDRIFLIKSVAFYSGRKGTGKVVWSDTRTPTRADIEPIIPGTIGESTLETVCKQ